MIETTEQLLQKVLALEEKDRAMVAGALIESLHATVEPGTARALENEIRRRVGELDSGAVETVPWPRVRKRLYRGLT